MLLPVLTAIAGLTRVIPNKGTYERIYDNSGAFERVSIAEVEQGLGAAVIRSPAIARPGSTDDHGPHPQIKPSFFTSEDLPPAAAHPDPV